MLSRRAVDEAEILTVVVDPSARRNGCGQRLLGAHLSRLAALGVTTVFLEVEEENVAALALYRRFGFVEGPTQETITPRPMGAAATPSSCDAISRLNAPPEQVRQKSVIAQA